MSFIVLLHKLCNIFPVSSLRLPSKSDRVLTEEDISRRRKLRTVKSADSLLSASASMREVRTSQGSSGTGATFMNPYAKSGNFSSRIVLAFCFIQASTFFTSNTYGLLPDMDSDTNSNSDSKLDGYIVLYRNCSQREDSNLDSNSDWDARSLLHPFCGWISITRLGSECVSGNVNKPLFEVYA